MPRIQIVDVGDSTAFGLLPPCVDPSFDHRSCDYWEDAERGSKAARALNGPTAGPSPRPRPSLADNPFARPQRSEPINPFLVGEEPEIENPFLPRRAPIRPALEPDAPRKLNLLTRGLGIFGSYAKVLTIDDEPVAYVQFGPLSAYPRALRLRDFYPQLPQAPLPAVITCIAATAAGRHKGYGQRLIAAAAEDLGQRGFAAVETYPEAGAAPDATSGASPAFWEAAGFVRVVDDDHFPVYRRELE
jgi:GNAT superfamily N-acetyltransferase